MQSRKQVDIGKRFLDMAENYLEVATMKFGDAIIVGIPFSESDFYAIFKLLEEINLQAKERGISISIDEPRNALKEFGNPFVYCFKKR